MHAAAHLPGIFDDQLEPTEKLMRRRISVLKICESRLLGSVSNLNRVVEYVNDLQQIRRGKCHVSNDQSHGSHVPSSGLFPSRGVHFGPSGFTGISSALENFAGHSCMLACLSERDRQDLITRQPPSST